MKTIESFTVNHLDLFPGIYTSRVDRSNDTTVTTYDLRMMAPNREPVMDMPAVHTIEHLGATYLRNGEVADEVVYFGPMGCRTGFYLVMFGERTPEEIFEIVEPMIQWMLEFDGPIPGATPEQCGNYSEQNLSTAQYYLRRYLDELQAEHRFVYPE